jgi:hypothetical protein
MYCPRVGVVSEFERCREHPGGTRAVHHQWIRMDCGEIRMVLGFLDRSERLAEERRCTYKTRLSRDGVLPTPIRYNTPILAMKWSGVLPTSIRCNTPILAMNMASRSVGVQWSGPERGLRLDHGVMYVAFRAENAGLFVLADVT